MNYDDKIIEDLLVQKQSTTITSSVNQDILIDILLIDAEGHDPLVLAGSIKSLKLKRIRVIIFEYHNIGIWRKTILSLWITKLSELGYVCYYEGKDMWRLTGTVCRI